MREDILCIYYSRTGRTDRAMHRIAKELDCEIVELKDDAKRLGFFGWLRCGLDAVRKTTRPVQPIETQKALDEYRLVILGTPVWAGRCSSVMRSFLKKHGKELKNVACVTTHRCEDPYRDVFRQMDQYLAEPHGAEVSLCPKSAGYEFWINQFITTLAAETAEN